ncbi:hypothetical protein [Parasitella parasitica]|uniref:Uncharacterized protein n=1 Tax=Parasitella parasitica TaxID=35722 RepID=A0A0B7MSX7_9FUNG|nr:hypothetical protein [Parasitella parasitica]
MCDKPAAGASCAPPIGTKVEKNHRSEAKVDFFHCSSRVETARYYNNVITAERPKIQTAFRGTKTTATFQRIFIQAKALKNSRAQISAASIKAIGDQAQSSAGLLKRDDSTTEESDDESYAEEKNAEDEDGSSEMEERAIKDETSLIAEKNEDENYASKIRNMAITKLLDPKYIIDAMNIPGKEHNNSIRHILYKKAHSIIQQESIDAISAELLKLSLSNILNFTNPYLRNIYESLIPTGETKKTNHIRQQKKDELEFDDNMSIMIDEVLDQLELYTTTCNTDKLRTIIDELKYKEPNKRSPKCQLLNVVEIVVRGFHFWKGASPKSELAYLRKFEELLDVIMDDTELNLSDGESVCVSTRNSLRKKDKKNAKNVLDVSIQIPGATSFQDLRTYDGEIYHSAN